MNIPLFPLGMTLFPDGLAALKIFEVRYLDMTRSSFREGTPFGIVTLNQGSEVRQPTEQISFADIGTLAEIVFGTHQTKRSGSVGICGGALALMICQ